MANKTMTVTASLLLAAALTACSGTKDGTKPQTASEPENNKPVELVAYLPGYTHEKFMLYFGDYIQKQYPNVSFKVIGGTEQLTDLVAAGVKLDLIQTTVPSQITDNGLQDDLTDLIAKYKYDLNKLEPAVLEGIKQIGDGKIYGFPNGVATAAMYYNKALFDKFGVSYPVNGMTWDQAFELAKKVTRTEGGIAYQGFASEISLIADINQLSQGFVDPKTNKATLNNANWRTFIENFSRFHTIPGNPYDIKGGANNAFKKEQRIAMLAYVLEPTTMTDYTNSGVDWGVVSLPEFAGHPGVGPAPLVPMFYVGKTAANRDWAFKVAAYMGSEQFQKDSATKIGAITALRNHADVMANYAKEVPTIPAEKQAAKAVPKAFAKPMAVTPYNAIVNKEFRTAFAAVASGQKDVNTALREAEEKANQEIEAAKRK